MGAQYRTAWIGTKNCKTGNQPSSMEGAVWERKSGRIFVSHTDEIKNPLHTWLDYANMVIERVSVNDGLVVMIWQIEFRKLRRRESRNS